MLQLPPRQHKVDADVASTFAAAALHSSAEHDPLFRALRLHYVDDPANRMPASKVRPILSSLTSPVQYPYIKVVFGLGCMPRIHESLSQQSCTGVLQWVTFKGDARWWAATSTPNMICRYYPMSPLLAARRHHSRILLATQWVPVIYSIFIYIYIYLESRL